MLEVRNLSVRYGAYTALHGVNLTVNDGEIVVLLGANGAGKSSLFRTLSGLQRPSGGDALYNGEVLTLGRPERCVALGVSQCPEGRLLFPHLSVEKNLRLGAYLHRRDAAGNGAELERIYALFPILHDKRADPAGSLSGGQQQMVAIGRALLNKPRVLLCDEISLGLAPKVIREIYAALPEIRAAGTAMVLVEQDVGLAKSASDRLYCMLEGRVTLTGASADISRDAIQAAYFGASHAVA